MRGIGRSSGRVFEPAASMKKKKILIADGKPRPKRLNLRAYTHIRGYHACRPVDIAKYYAEGLVLFDEKGLQQTARSIFSLPPDKELNDRLLPYRSRIFFCLFKQQLIRGSGHYLCYGSEYLAGVAARLDRYIAGPYHDILLRTGIPTIFICDVPLELISEPQIEDISSNYCSDHTDWCFALEQSLPPEHIAGHEHPPRIFDPLVKYVRVNEQVRCPLCASTDTSE